MYQSYKDGWIETISGCMFAGKTEELIRRIKVLEFAKKEIMVFKPQIDNRYSQTKVVSHAGSSVESYVVSSAREILEMVKDSTEVVAIDEAQFFYAMYVMPWLIEVSELWRLDLIQILRVNHLVQCLSLLRKLNL